MENTNSLSRQTVLIIASGFFVAFCLFVYQAYGISGGVSATGHPLWFRAIVFGLITSGCFAFNERRIYPKITASIKNKKHWLACTFGK